MKLVAEIYFDKKSGDFTVKNVFTGIEGTGITVEDALNFLRINTEHADRPAEGAAEQQFWRPNFLD